MPIDSAWTQVIKYVRLNYKLVVIDSLWLSQAFR